MAKKVPNASLANIEPDPSTVTPFILPDVARVTTTIETVQILTSEIEEKPSALYVSSIGASSGSDCFTEYFEKVGFKVPIVVAPNPEGSDFRFRVVDGNSRLRIAMELNWMTIPCVIVDDETEESLLRIGLNVTRQKSRFEHYLELNELKALLGYKQGTRLDKNVISEGSREILMELASKVGSSGTITSLNFVVRALKVVRDQGGEEDKKEVDTLIGLLATDSISASAAKRQAQKLITKVRKEKTYLPLPSALEVDSDMNTEAYQLIVGDTREVARKGEVLPLKGVQCVFTSPPYFNRTGIHYEGDPNLSTTADLDFYVNGLADIFTSLKPYLSEDHTVWVNLGDGMVGGEYTCAPYAFVLEMKRRGFRLIDEYIWSKPNPIPNGNLDITQVTRSHENIFVFSCAETTPLYTPTLLTKVNGATGTKSQAYSVNMSANIDHSVWHTSGAASYRRLLQLITGVEINHPALFPLALPWLALQIATRANSVVLDPFCGQSGMVGLATQELGEGRRFIGIDQNEAYARAYSLILAKAKMGKVDITTESMVDQIMAKVAA